MRQTKGKEPNLYNMTKGKNKAVIDYILDLKENHNKWSIKAIMFFRKTIKEALDMSCGNDMLRHIGWRPNQEPKLLEDCLNMS